MDHSVIPFHLGYLLKSVIAAVIACGVTKQSWNEGMFQGYSLRFAFCEMQYNQPYRTERAFATPKYLRSESGKSNSKRTSKSPGGMYLGR